MLDNGLCSSCGLQLESPKVCGHCGALFPDNSPRTKGVDYVTVRTFSFTSFNDACFEGHAMMHGLWYTLSICADTTVEELKRKVHNKIQTSFVLRAYGFQWDWSLNNLLFVIRSDDFESHNVKVLGNASNDRNHNTAETVREIGVGQGKTLYVLPLALPVYPAPVVEYIIPSVMREAVRLCSFIVQNVDNLQRPIDDSKPVVIKFAAAQMLKDYDWCRILQVVTEVYEKSFSMNCGIINNQRQLYVDEDWYKESGKYQS